MAKPNEQITVINKNQEDQIIQYAIRAHELLLNQFSLRQSLEEIDRYYMRENDFTDENIRGRLAARAGNKKQRVMQNVTVPIIMPQVRAALGYMVNVFLTGYPIFGVSGDPAQEDAALQMETIIAENAITAGWARQLMLFFNDGLKYNIHGVECTWEQKNVAAVKNSTSEPGKPEIKNTLWAGNVLRRMDLYNTFYDPRVHPAEIHSEGEYAGYIQLFSRVRMKKFINDLFGKVTVDKAERAFESSIGQATSSSLGTPFSYYQPIINPFAVMPNRNMQTFDWMAWVSGGNQNGTKQIRYTNVYEVMTLYGRILPSDFGFKVPAANTPQVWKFIIINGSVVLYAEKMTNAHNWIPIFFGQPLEDGLDYQTKSFAQNVEDMQDVASAFMNGYIASKRRLVGDRVLYDPMRIREKDINSSNPAAKIPVRPSAYGKTVSEAVYQFPYHDEQTQTLLNGVDVVSKFADKVNSQNGPGQGQFQKGNKTKFEYQDVMGNSETGNQMMALMTEGQVFGDLKECIKLNILLNQQDTVLYNREQNTQVDVSATDLRAASVHFKVSDGMTPAEKEMSTDEFQTVIQTALQAPQLAAGMDITDMFVYLMKLRGADLRPFAKSPAQMQYEQQQQAWQQMGQAAIQKGVPFNTPMPQPTPAYQAEMAGKQRDPNQVTPSTQLPPSPTEKAAEATQGLTARQTNPAIPSVSKPPPGGGNGTSVGG